MQEHQFARAPLFARAIALKEWLSTFSHVGEGGGFFLISNKIWYPTLRLKNLLDIPQKDLENISYSLLNSQLKAARKTYLIVFILKKSLLQVLALQYNHQKMTDT